MKKKILLVIITLTMLLSLALTGCGGVAQDIYDQIVEQLTQLQQQLADLQQDDAALAQAKEAAEAALAEAQAEIAALTEQYVLVGATDAETAERIVRYYYDTHYYQENVYDCTEMSADVWDMLKAQGISARIAIGNTDVPAFDDATLSNHSWVMAEVAPGEYLALEATGGYAVSRLDNGGYYRGWTFNDPAEVRLYYDLITESNVHVELRNQLATEVNQAASQGNMQLYNELNQLLHEQETEINNIRAEYEALAVKM